MWRFAVAIGLVGMLALGLAVRVDAVGAGARGTLVDGTGKTIGSVELAQAVDGVAIRLRLDNLEVVKAGKHGFHLHAVGKCDGPDFTSAGGHFNPTNKQHGTKNPQGAHAGDLENLVVAANTAGAGGSGWATTSALFSLSSGPTGIFDADGAALVIHANEDDEATDPTGNSGGRVACAVLALTAPGLPNTGAGGVATPWSGVLLVGTLTMAVTILVATARVTRRRA